ncbi:MAG: hypothetical protein LBP88_03730 [Treponema sp.]|jgi:hypothetical protein|nr:hypothetical protein [Treponema sp.]
MADDTSLDPGLEKAIMNDVGPLIVSAGITMAVAFVTGAVLELIGTNIKTSSLTGDEGIHPTKDETAINNVDTTANEVDGSLNQDGVAGRNGAVKADETDASALTGEATASESGVSALRTKTGASDIETKALKMT